MPDEDAVEVVGRLVRGQPGGVVVLVGPNVVRVLGDLDRKERYLLLYFSNFASNWILPLISYNRSQFWGGPIKPFFYDGIENHFLRVQEKRN